MKVVAVRDDGALLITSGRAALIHSPDGTWVTSVDSALARGGWEPASGPLPSDLPKNAEAQLAEFEAQLKRSQYLIDGPSG